MTRPEPTLCPRLDYIGSTGLSADGGSESHQYWVKWARTAAEARKVAIEGIPLYLPSEEILATKTENISATKTINAGDVKLYWPPRYFATLDITGGLEQNAGKWLATANYEGCDDRGYDMSFGTVGGSIHIDQSIATSGYGNFADFKNAVGINDDGGVDGADIVSTSPRFTLSKCFPPGFLGCAEFKELAGLIGINENPWDPDLGETGVPCFGAEELLFLGVDGNIPPRGVVRINFHYEYQPTISKTLNLQNLGGVGRSDVAVPIPGHSHLNVHYKRDIVGNFQIKLAHSAYVHRVYQRIPFGPFSNYGLPA